MNETVSYLNSITEEFDIFEFFRYHAIGRNSEPNYISLFCGTTKERAYWLNENNDDIFKKIYKNRYKSLLFDPFEDWSNSFFHLDHKLVYSNMPRCIGSKQIHQHYFKFQEEAMKYYHKNNQLIFSLNIFSESHNV